MRVFRSLFASTHRSSALYGSTDHIGRGAHVPPSGRRVSDRSDHGDGPARRLEQSQNRITERNKSECSELCRYGVSFDPFREHSEVRFLSCAFVFCYPNLCHNMHKPITVSDLCVQVLLSRRVRSSPCPVARYRARPSLTSPRSPQEASMCRSMYGVFCLFVCCLFFDIHPSSRSRMNNHCLCTSPSLLLHDPSHRFSCFACRVRISSM